MPQTLQLCKMVVARLCFLSLLCVKAACFAPTLVQNNRITPIGGTVLALSSGGPFEEERADESETNERKIVNPFYGVHKIQRLQGLSDDKCLALDKKKSRRLEKVQAWEQALRSNKTSWGERQAVKDAPIWATPEVLQGGFVSGTLLAELKEGDVPNQFYLTGPGLLELEGLLRSGCYRLQYPEHGALLMVAWLLNENQVDDAFQILVEIAPYFDRLRFYPDRAKTPLIMIGDPSNMFIASVGEVKEDISNLLRMETNVNVPRIRAKISHRRAIDDWLPMKWRMQQLWMETQGDDGIPGRRFPPGWWGRAMSLLLEFIRLAGQDRYTNRKRARKGSTYTMAGCIAKCLVSREDRFGDNDRQMLQNILLGSSKKTGLPGSTKFGMYQSRIRKYRPSERNTKELESLIEVLDSIPSEDLEGGLDAQAVDVLVASSPCMAHATLRRATVGSINELIQIGVISSSEELAQLVPKLVAWAMSTHAPDESLGRLGYALECAFDHRWSVLLLNTNTNQSRVRFAEIPWSLPLLFYREGKRESALSMLNFIVETTINAFPHTALPNKMLRYLQSLAEQAGKEMHLTEDLAGDLFLGKFSDNFERSARLAAELLKGSPYERYYGLNYEKIAKREAPLAELVKRDTRILYANHEIEVQQIITTHNLAACFSVLDIELDAQELALKAWDNIINDLRSKDIDWRRIAYAWRQILFFISIAPDTSDLLDQMEKRCFTCTCLNLYADGYSIDDLFLRQLKLVLSGHHPDNILLGYPFHDPIVGNEKSEVLCLGFTLVPVTLGESRGRTAIL